MTVRVQRVRARAVQQRGPLVKHAAGESGTTKKKIRREWEAGILL